MNASKVAGSSVQCKGLSSGSNAVLQEGVGSDRRGFACGAERSCTGASITSNPNYNNNPGVSADGAYALFGATIVTVKNGNHYMRGHFAGYNAHFTCSSGDTCSIECNGNACFGLFVEEIGDVAVTLIDDAIAPIYDEAEWQSLIDSGPYDTLYTADPAPIATAVEADCNSMAHAQTFDTGFANTDQFLDLYATAETGPVCCRGRGSCQRSTITLSGTALACQGSRSCRGVSVTSDAVVLCIGDLACYTAGDDEANITTSLSLFCSGQQSCYAAVELTAPTIYCTGSQACREARIVSGGDMAVYMLGRLAARDATVVCNANHICIIYCSATAECEPNDDNDGIVFEGSGTVIIHDWRANFFTTSPTASPTAPSAPPTAWPSRMPSTDPTTSPSNIPSDEPTRTPSPDPTIGPSSNPTTIPTTKPTADPTVPPSTYPSLFPSHDPTNDPTNDPTSPPSESPSADPTEVPSANPTNLPSVNPTQVPSADPTDTPSQSADPTKVPSSNPSNVPSANPTELPSSDPTKVPSAEPTAPPSSDPSVFPTVYPSSPAYVSDNPTSAPLSTPTASPTVDPTTDPTGAPSANPSVNPRAFPTAIPSNYLSAVPTNNPTAALDGSASEGLESDSTTLSWALVIIATCGVLCGFIFFCMWWQSRRAEKQAMQNVEMLSSGTAGDSKQDAATGDVGSTAV